MYPVVLSYSALIRIPHFHVAFRSSNINLLFNIVGVAFGRLLNELLRPRPGHIQQHLRLLKRFISELRRRRTSDCVNKCAGYTDNTELW